MSNIIEFAPADESTEVEITVTARLPIVDGPPMDAPAILDAVLDRIEPEVGRSAIAWALAVAHQRYRDGGPESAA